MRAVNTAFVMDWATAAVADVIGMGVADALQRMRTGVTDYILRKGN